MAKAAVRFLTNGGGNGNPGPLWVLNFLCASVGAWCVVGRTTQSAHWGNGTRRFSFRQFILHYDFVALPRIAGHA